ncbi:MAG: acetyltransferase [Planctomycetota bacterium]|jgi:sugar O-acyltransferase (sialic acid O-acetyltransferase NeuD family)
MKRDMEKVLILGTGMYAPVLAEIISSLENYEVGGFVENLNKSHCNEKLAGLNVYWIEDLDRFAESHKAVCCLATTQRSRFIEQVMRYNIEFATIIHPSADVMSSTSIGCGSVVGPGVVISSNTKIGEHVRINRGVTIGHDTVIGDFVTVQPGVNIAGKCIIGDKCYIGMGSNIIDDLRIGSGCLVGAGSLVLKDLKERVMAFGVPAKVVKEDIDAK